MMGTEPGTRKVPAWCLAVVAGSALLGLTLMADQAYRLSATYDEVTHLRVAARWWRTGDQDAITRMGTPVTFWKIQQAPTLWALDRLGYRGWVDDPIANQAALLPIVRIGGFWVWLVALGIATVWSLKLYGPRAAALASLIFTLEPNLLAHGALSTAELPAVACISGMCFGFRSFLDSGRARAFWATAVLGGLAMSCKFTTILIPPILGLVWAIDLWRKPDRPDSPHPETSPTHGPFPKAFQILRIVLPGMLGFLLAMAAANFLITGFSMVPLSPRYKSHPFLDGRVSPAVRAWGARILESSFPRDWVGFATQTIYQGRGGSSYLLGVRRMTGWWYYYPVTLAVKVPIALWLLIAARAALSDGIISRGRRGWALPVMVVAFLLLAMMGSKRNYGVRYLLPVAPLAIVWASAIAEGGRRARWIAAVGVGGMAASIVLIHPHELTYFNEAAGGPIGGRRVLSDSNLDWGQGARALARLQGARPELRDLTLFYFGETDPAFYGVRGRRFLFDANKTPAGLPRKLEARSRYLAVSASLQFGPWGPPGYFRKLDGIPPESYTDDTTIAIYRTADLEASGGR